MKKITLLPLALALLTVPTVSQASMGRGAQTHDESKLIMAGFLNDLKESVEDVKETVETTNETTTDTIDGAHGVNEAVGNSQQIIKGNGESQDSTVIEQTEILETTDGVEEAGESGDSF